MSDGLGTVARYGFSVPAHGLATDASQAVELARAMGESVALKIVSPDIVHKTEVGGVVLGLSGDDEVRAGYGRLLEAVGERAPQARIEGVSVEQMHAGGTEVIIGLNQDSQFGPVIMFGLGGILTELFEDVVFRVVPISRHDAAEMIRGLGGARLLSGFRGQPPVSGEMLVDLLMRASSMAEDLGGKFESVDLNPVLVRGDQHVVLDAKFLPAGANAARALGLGGRPNLGHLAKFFDPGSVALVGASASASKVGGAVLESLGRQGYSGRVFPINPGRGEIMGLSAYPSLRDVPEKVDLVTVTVPLAAVPALLADCAATDVHNMVVISAGGKELGAEGEELEATIRRLARENDVRVVGCNCIGVLDSASHFDTFFYAPERMVRPPAGPIALMTQSGTVGAVFMERLGGTGISKFVSYGNRIDVDEGDLLAFFADDPETRVIACYLEGLEDGRKFLSAAADAVRKKPVVAFKAARTRLAATASVSHTGFFGGSHQVVEGAFRQAGIISVDSIDELVAAAKALAMQPRAKGPRVGLISNGAGAFVQAIDLLPAYGLELPGLSEMTVKRLRDAYPPYYMSQNPIDVTGSATSGDYEVGVSALIEDPAVDVVMPWFVFQNSPLDEKIVEVMGRLNGRGKPVVCGAMGGPYTARMSAAVEEAGVPVFHAVRDWVAAAGALAPLQA